MSAHRTIWHFSFTILLRKRGSRAFEVRDEVPLSEERLRMDFLLLRKQREVPPDDACQTLRALWSRLPRVTVAELKSIGRVYRKGDLDRLWGYVHLCCADEQNGIKKRDELCAMLLVPSRSPALDADVAAMGLAWNDLQGGYWELTGGLFRLYVVEFEVVADHENDDVLRSFGRQMERTTEALRFWAEVVGTKEATMSAQQLEGYDEAVRRFLEALSPEQRLAGLAPEQRLAGLAPEQALLALPDEVLRRLISDDYLATLPEPTRSELRRRLGR